MGWHGAAGAAIGAGASRRQGAAIARGLGAAENITSVDCCATRLRCCGRGFCSSMRKLLKSDGRRPASSSRDTGVQVIYGPRVAVIKSNETIPRNSPNIGPEATALQSPKAAEKLYDKCSEENALGTGVQAQEANPPMKAPRMRPSQAGASDRGKRPTKGVSRAR